VVHRPIWPCAKPNQLKTFVHQYFHGIYLGAFVGQSNPHISKITNFIFSQNSPPSHLAIPSCTDKLSHVQTPTNLKLLCTKTFMVFIWGQLEANPTLTSQKPRISFFHKTPYQALYRGAPTNLAMCKTQPTQNFCAPRLSWYLFGGISKPIQPSHLKNHEFHFFTKLQTKPSSYAVVHRPTWPCAKPNQLKTFVHQDFIKFIWGHLETNPTLTSQKPRISFFSQNSLPSHLLMPWPCAKPSELKTFLHQEFHGIHLGRFGCFSNPHI